MCSDLVVCHLAYLMGGGKVWVILIIIIITFIIITLQQQQRSKVYDVIIWQNQD